eukprot:TRINITY_DN40804_c0_g2_i1.p1 TRINITY_DN40804_c0_g2~~TRINITY_DN40804_c0_g2_i1.p1  ORF type:complete len:718 (+),score=104.00 TRINITY_DN40804_c0_g2_i1:108-2156(+)
MAGCARWCNAIAETALVATARRCEARSCGGGRSGVTVAASWGRAGNHGRDRRRFGSFGGRLGSRCGSSIVGDHCAGSLPDRSRLDVASIERVTKSTSQELSPAQRASAIHRLGKRRQWRQALALIEDPSEQGTSEPHESSMSMPLSAAVAACASASRWEHSVFLLQRMWSSRLPPDVLAYTACLGGLERHALWERALQLTELMKHRGVEPDLWVWNRVLAACGGGHQWMRAVAVFNSLSSRGCAPDLVSYNTTISACAKSSHWTCALHLYSDMLAPLRGVSRRLPRPDVITFGSLAAACERGSQAKRAVRLLEGMRGFDVQPNVVVYSATLGACLRAEMWKKGLDLLVEMRETSIMPNVITYGAAASAAEQSSLWELSLELCWEALSSMKQKQIQRRDRCGGASKVTTVTDFATSPDPGDSSFVVDTAGAVETSGAVGGHAATIKKSRDSGATSRHGAQNRVSVGKHDHKSSNAVLLSVVVAACGRGLLWEAALGVLKEALGERVRPDEVMYSASIAACDRADKWEHAARLLADAWNTSLDLGDIALTRVIGACERQSKWAAAYRALADARSRDDFIGTWLMFGVAARAGVHGSQWELAFALLDDARELKLRPDPAAARAVTLALADAGRGAEAAAFYRAAFGEGTGDVISETQTAQLSPLPTHSRPRKLRPRPPAGNPGTA